MNVYLLRVLLSLRQYGFVLLFICSCSNLSIGNAYAQEADTSARHEPRNWDERTFRTINNWGKTSPELDVPMEVFTYSLSAANVAVPLALYGYGLQKDDLNASRAGVGIAAGEGIAIGLNLIIKNIVQRKRPYYELNDVRTPTEGSSGYSFPSGHATLSFALATGLSLYYPKWYVIAPTFAYAAIVSLSRPYLGVHYPTDIIAGAVLGAGSAFLGRELEKLIYSYEPKFYPDPAGLLGLSGDQPFKVNIVIPLGGVGTAAN